MPELWRNPFRGTKNIPVRQFPGKQESSLSININETVLFQHITGIEIKETWQEKSVEWFAVAVLNKKKASDYYSSLAKEQGQKIQALITKAKFSAPSLDSANVFVRYNFASPRYRNCLRQCCKAL